MRKTLLTSVAVLGGLVLAMPAFAQGSSTPPASDQTYTTPAAKIPSPHRLMREGAMNPQTGARWGHTPGVGISLPTSSQASNIESSDTRSIIAPTLPTPPVARNAGAEQFLSDAQRALSAHRTGEAQEALERAETRRLDFDVTRNVAPSDDPMIARIRSARDDLAGKRYAAVQQQIASAMSVGASARAEPMNQEGNAQQ